jgi:hypothetical protein
VNLEALVRLLSTLLSDAGIPFMLTGSVAAGYRGASRATMDVDAVIDPTASRLRAFVHAVPDAGLYVSEEAASDALATRGMFNVVDPLTGWKADLIVRKHRAFSEEEFDRREAVGLVDRSQGGCPGPRTWPPWYLPPAAEGVDAATVAGSYGDTRVKARSAPLTWIDRYLHAGEVGRSSHSGPMTTERSEPTP